VALFFLGAHYTCVPILHVEAAGETIFWSEEFIDSVGEDAEFDFLI
jgi:hypothetical protein